MTKLALFGGPKVRNTPFGDQTTYGPEEMEAVKYLMSNKKLLSNYRGNWIAEFWGGDQVKAFEDMWSEKFKNNYSLAVNSCTSALQVACGAIGLKPGDEVIVTPWSMSCSATAPLVWGATPVFADIDPETFCLSPEDVRKRITGKTKAIIAVDLFGHPFSEEINKIADENNLYIIEDAAQAPGAKRNGVYTGGLGHIGCFSFTQGKHMTCGEGGMITTNDEELAFKCALIRNHSEAVLSAMEDKYGTVHPLSMNSIPGFNLRMTEISAAIMREQLKKLDRFIESRIYNVVSIDSVIKSLSFISEVPVDNNIDHSYYVHPFLFDEEKAGVSRDLFIEAVKAELTGEISRPGRPMLGYGYIKPLYRMPIFWHRNFNPLSFPVVEKLWKKDFFLSMYHNLPLSAQDIQQIGDAFHKVAENISELKNEKMSKTPEKSLWRRHEL